MGSSPALPALPSPCPCHTGARDLGLAAGLSLWQVLRWAQVLEEGMRIEQPVGSGHDPVFFYFPASISCLSSNLSYSIY